MICIKLVSIYNLYYKSIWYVEIKLWITKNIPTPPMGNSAICFFKISDACLLYLNAYRPVCSYVSSGWNSVQCTMYSNIIHVHCTCLVLYKDSWHVILRRIANYHSMYYIISCFSVLYLYDNKIYNMVTL